MCCWWMSGWPEEIVRAKGFIWLATRMELAQSISQAGPSISFGPAGYWAAALPEDELNLIMQEQPELAHDWHPEHGDRINRIVFIGIGLKPDKVTASLDTCLLADEEMTEDWSLLADRLPGGS